DPRRINLRAAGEYIKDASSMAAQYASWVTPGEIDSADDLPPEQGAILRRGATKIAVYRDKQGRVHERSAICPHLGCIVEFNTVEQSWDGPCHGSRSTAEGEVTNGPANSPLARLD